MAIVSNSKSASVVSERPAMNTLSNNNSQAYENYAELTRAYDRLSNLRDTLAGYGACDSAGLEECMPSGIVDYGARVNRDSAITIENIHAVISEISNLLN